MNKALGTLIHLLCSNGYLPPRNEEELLEQEKKIKGHKFKTDGMHIDTKKITNKTDKK